MSPIPPIWCPDQTTIQLANLTTLLQRTALSDYEALHAWSCADPEGYWGVVLENLPHAFTPLGPRILIRGQTPEEDQWLPDAQGNIALPCLEGDAEAPALVCQDEGGPVVRCTRGQLRTDVRRIAANLRRLGFDPGARLAILMPMDGDAVRWYLGMLYAGCTVISIADSFAPGEIARRLEIGGAKAIIVRAEFTRAGKSIPLYERVRAATHLPALVQGASHLELRPEDIDWDREFRKEELSTPFLGPADHIVNILFSSGTTGDPKAIPWTQVTPLKCIADGRYHQDIHPGDVVVWPTNLGWMMGPWLIFAGLANRAAIGLFSGAPHGEAFAGFVESARVTMLGVIPSLVKHWRSTRIVEGRDWSSVRCFSSTGEASHPDDMRYLSLLAGGKPIIEYCGGTEIGGGFITSSMLHPNVPGQFACAALGNRFVILDETGRPSDEGELFLIPPSLGLSQSLLNRDHHATYHLGTPQSPQGELLRRHGDHFTRLPGGGYLAGGRVDDTMNLGGIKVASAELERVLNGVPGVRETAAVAVPGEGGGPEELVVYAVMDGHNRSAEDLREAMNHRLRDVLNPLFRVSQVITSPALPRTASNKVLRRELRQEFLNKRTTAPVVES